MNSVVKEVEEHIARTDVRYYCPHCDVLLWRRYYFPLPMLSKCPVCKKAIVWDELKYYKDLDCYAVNDEIVEKYCGVG